MTEVCAEKDRQDNSMQTLQAKNIQAIDRQAVHRICSGQVVLNLATAVKELVENSLDAGANIIEVRLREYGSEVLEVIDNGVGVKKENFEGLTLKHHTSKLRDFSDLTSVDTFGFRGEALSSLCALSKLTITTCHIDDQVGCKLEYDHSGKLLSTIPCARQTGTTVSLQNLFSTLPVRHKEFQRNLKKEFNKMVQVLNAYCIISTKVKLTCTNQLGKGKKNIVVNINDNESMKENITNIFGAKQMQSLIEFEQHNPREEEQTEYGINNLDHKKIFKVSGYVSTCEHGKGRSATDRQFFFVNKRPCDLIKVSRVVNEVYHMYNRYQYPFVVLEISLDKDSVDVNVTPDKRQIFVENEKLLLAIIKTSLIKLFEPRASLYTVNPGIQKSSSTITSMFAKDTSSPPIKSLSCPAVLEHKLISAETKKPNLLHLKRSFASAFAKDNPSEDDSDKEEQNLKQKQRKLDIFVVKSQRKDEENKVEQLQTDVSSPHTDPISGNHTKNSNITEQDSHEFKPAYSIVFEELKEMSSTGDSLNTVQNSDLNNSTETILLEDVRTSEWGQSPDVRPLVAENKSAVDTGTPGSPQHNNDNTCDNTDSHLLNETGDQVQHISSKQYDSSEESCVNRKSKDDNTDYNVIITEVDKKEAVTKKETKLQFSMSELCEKLKRHQLRSESGKEGTWCRAFRSKITPGDNQSAEEELNRQISKDMFPQMEILGQFNLGFIIGKLKSDLFIIDQHATDEKYNFEMLQRHTVIQNQKLIQPQVMELTAANETILIDNLDIFKKNGFEFIINEEDAPTQRVKLISMPVSKNWTFGKEDIEELVFMLSESPGVMCRPSRVRMMFASRACRKSIMIGTALNKAEMKKLVHHMSEIEQPWNCPHGRPTMRHLINLEMLPK